MLLQTIRWAMCVIAVVVQCNYSYLFAAEDFQISPLPLAKDAKSKPDESPKMLAKQRLEKIYVHANILLGEHKFDELEQIAADYWLLYQAGKIPADDYLEVIYQLTPYKAGKAMLNDVLEWTRERPKSYIAWQVLGALYRDIAWQERGTGWARETSPEQFRAMGEYAKLSYAALLKSLSLSPTPLATYPQLISVAAILPRHDDGQIRREIKRRVESLLASMTHAKVEIAGDCAWAPPLSDAVRPVWNEQLGYLCQSWRIDPNATRAFQRVVMYNRPRWGGSYTQLEALFNVLSKDRNLSVAARGEMLASLLEKEGDDVVDRDAHVGAELYERAFDASPTALNITVLWKAQQAEQDKVKNQERALVLLNKIMAVQAGDVNTGEAMFRAGVIYDERGDQKKYMEHMITAAMLGGMGAQNNVGYFYMVGQRGLPRDLHEAKAWLTLSANQGFDHAREKLKVVDEMIAKEQSR